MTDCLSEEQLRYLATGAVPEAEAASLRGHVEQCPSCRELLDEWRENLAFMSTLKESVTDLLAVTGAVRGRTRDNGTAERVEGYELREEVHCGAQGVVYRAVRQSTSAEVAIKFLRDGQYASEATRRRFEREVDLVAGLHHPSIIEIQDAGVSATGRQYYVMDFVQGLPLHRYVWDRKLSLDDTLKLFIQVCEAVNYAHQRGVIHRDLKPSNILVGADGVPKVLDFGLARQIVAPPESFVSMTGQVMGTLPYMSPEQTRGDQAEVDIRTDVYALGVILYEILTGQYPYPAAGPIPEVLHHIAETPPTPPSRAWTQGSGIVTLVDRPRRGHGHGGCPIDDDLDTIVLRTLSKQPERRYPSVATLMDDLARYLRGQPIEARREAWVYDLHRRLTRYKAAVALVCACLILSVTFGVTAWRMSENQSRERTRAIEAQSRLAIALMKLGDNALDRGDLQDASGHFLAALAIAEHLAAGELQNLEYQSCRADSYVRLGHVAKERGDLTEAMSYYQRSYTILRQLAQSDPGNPLYCTRLLLASDLVADVADRQKGNQGTSVTRPAGQTAEEVQP